MPRILLAALFVVAAGVPLCRGQEQTTLTAAVFTVRNLLGDAANDEFQLLITEAVRIEVESAGYAIVGGWERALAEGEQAPVHGSRAAELARTVGAAVVFTGFLTRPDADTVALSVQCWEQQGETLLGSFSISEPFGLSFYNVLHDRMVVLVQAAERFTGPPRIEAFEVAAARGLGAITFLSSQDGTEVLLAGEKSLGTVVGGRLDAQVGLLSGGSPLELELRRPGYYAASVAVTAFPEIRLPELPKEHGFAAVVGWSNGQPVGMGGTFALFPVPDWFFVGALAYLGAQLPAAGSGDNIVLHLDTGVRSGFYLMPFDSRIRLAGAEIRLPFRIGIAAGAGLLTSLSFGPALPTWLDWYIAMPQPFLEIGTGDAVFTLQFDLRYSLGLPGGVLPRGWIERSVPDTTRSEGYRTETPVTLGVRFRW